MSTMLPSKFLSIALLCLLGLRGLVAGESAPGVRALLDEAELQIARCDVKQFEQTLRRAWQSDGEAKDRVEAGVALARELWRIQRKSGEAREVLAAARALGAKPAGPLIELAALEAFEGNYNAACEAARAGLAVSANAQERRAARTSFGQAVCNEIFQTTLRTNRVAAAVATEARVREACELLDTVMREEPGWRETSRCQVLLALLAGNGPGALRAWQSYYLLVPGAPTIPAHTDPPREFGDLVFKDGKWVNRPLPFTEPGEVLARLLPTFSSEADVQTREKVVRALAGSRFFPEAAALALQWQLKPDKSIGDIIGYGRWTDNLSRRIAEEYRLQALGKNDLGHRRHLYIPYILDAYIGQTRLEKIIAAELKKLWKEQHPGPHAASFSRRSSAIDLTLGFGVVTYGLNLPGLCCYGHSVLQAEPMVEQYGRKKVMKWIVLDSMVSTGYGNWLRETTGFSVGGVGGWAIPPAEFVQIRGDDSLYVWEAMTDPELNRRAKEKMERWTTEDEVRAKTDPCGYFRGLAARLSVRSNDRLHERLKAQGLSGVELRTAFLRERERLVNACWLVAHEGRHALDLSEKPKGFSDADLEFRAKCSEVAFAPDPLMAVGKGSIFSPDINPSGSGHGLADARIMKGLFAWMTAHATEIPALDPSRPLLPQFDRLNDEQMREAFRSMDPWAKTPVVSSRQDL
jgi:hypothetical protein